MELAPQLNVRLVDTSVAPLDGDGFDGVPGAGHTIVTVMGLDQEDVTEVWAEHLACVLTWKVPAEPHAFDARVVPGESHPECVPSPQSKRY